MSILIVLFNCLKFVICQIYGFIRREHKNILELERNGDITRRHQAEFPKWFAKRVSYTNLDYKHYLH